MTEEQKPAQDLQTEAPKLETVKEKEKREKELKKYAPKYGSVGKITVTRSFYLGSGKQDISIDYYPSLDDDSDIILAKIQPLIEGLAPKPEKIAWQPEPQVQEQPPQQSSTTPAEQTDAQKEQERIRAGIDPEAPATEKQYKAMFAIWARMGKPPELKPVSKMTRLEASAYIEKYGNTSKVTPATELPTGVRRQYF